jgi:hypothetical protein
MRSLSLLLLGSAALLAVDPTSGKKLVFSDDFTTDKIDDTKWNLSGKPEAFSIVKGGKEKDGKVLRITLIQGVDMLQYNGINTRGKFEQMYGYFEASIRMPAYKGHTAYFKAGAIDEKLSPMTYLSFEGLGADTIMPWAKVVNDAGTHDYRPEGKMTQFLKPTEATKKFNTYGVLWTEKSYVWFINGKQVHKLDRAEFKKPMIISVYHRVAEFERPSLNLKQLPDDVDIDWVKAWK